MEKKNIRYGIMGCGEHALRSHALPALDIPEFELVALCDPSEHQSAALQEKTGLQGVSRYNRDETFFSNPHLDAVVISSPDRFHTKQLLDAMLRGVHVLCEKPLATTVEELWSLEQTLGLASYRKLVITSCHPRRFDPPFLWIREQLPRLRDELGEVISIDFDFSYHKPGAGKGDLHVGLLMDHLNHEFDLMTFLFGSSGCRAHRLKDSQVGYHVAGVREDGLTFSFRGTRMLEAGRYPEYFRIRFARGELALNCENGEIRLSFHETGRVDTPRISATDYKARFASTMQNFADAILGRSQNYLTHEDLQRNSEIGVILTENEVWNSQ